MKKFPFFLLLLLVSGCFNGGAYISVRGPNMEGVANLAAQFNDWQRRTACKNGTVYDSRTASVETLPPGSNWPHTIARDRYVAMESEFICK